MSVEILKSDAEIKKARTELDRRGLSCLEPGWHTQLRRFGLWPGVSVGDAIKSWDVLRTTEFIENHVSKEQPVLDMGAYASEIPIILHRLGYANLAGIDLNPNLRNMPYAGPIRYEVADFMQAPFASSSFQAVTAISVIEHGFNGGSLLKEVYRLLRPDGFFIASFDYWPDKIDTEGTKLYDMSWTIFSADEVTEFIDQAKQHGLYPYSRINLTAGDKVVSHAGKNYTFAWLVLQKGAA
ncbi:MAG: class I SAM-dependent methyltransferase [Burkholderiales bacterium]